MQWQINANQADKKMLFSNYTSIILVKEHPKINKEPSRKRD